VTDFIFGIHTVRTLLEQSPDRVRELWILEGRQDAQMAAVEMAAVAAGVPMIRRLPRRELDARTGGASHQGVVARIVLSRALNEDDIVALLDRITETPLILVLDSVQDPHNLGACLRTADAAGVHAVIVPKDRAAGLSATVRKVASGAAETVPFVQVTNLARTLDELRERGIWLIGSADEAEASLFGIDLRGPLALVMGGEGKGLRRLTRERCDQIVRIPMAGTVESLNVSVATGVCLFEAVRQRSAPTVG
jgi:23S rRNA (guanosine2251-2'-O)-methyltransferase